MMRKATLLAGLAAGYVLGARDGRERYEQIKTKANSLWQDPRVQEKATKAQDLAKQKAPQVQEKVSKATQKSGGTSHDNGSGDSTSSFGNKSAATPATPTTRPTPPVTPAVTTPASSSPSSAPLNSPRTGSGDVRG